MKIYTKKGDQGYTSLYSGHRVPKNSINFIVIGELDELNTRIGMLCTEINLLNMKEANDLVEELRDIQRYIQTINTHIAIIDTKGSKLPELDDSMLTRIENSIDFMESKNSPLTKFIIPGATRVDACAQLCRTQTRKSERELVSLLFYEGTVNILEKNQMISKWKLNDLNLSPIISKYVNRLSDYFFVIARYLCTIQKISDIIL